MSDTSSIENSASFVEIVTDSGRMRELGDQWNALWTRCRGVGLFQSFDYCLDAWELVEEPKGRSLACAVGWRDGRLEAVWPFVVFRDRLWTYARQLAASGVELHEVLIDETVDAGDWLRRAWQALAAHTRIDVVEVSFFDDSPAAASLQSLPARSVETSTNLSVYVALRHIEDWDEYYGSLSKSYRKDFAKSRRRLEALGALELTLVEPGDDRIGSLVDWTLTQKQRWADQTGKKGEWLYSDDYRRFLKHQLAGDHEKNVADVLLTLTVDGDLLATQIGAVGEEKFEAVIAGFNAEFDKFSPGARMNEAMIHWAWSRGVDCDFGSGAEPYKTFWSRNQTRSITRRSSAVSWWGASALASRRAAQRAKRLRERLPRSLRN